MYYNEIKEILKNAYDVCAHTLDYGSTIERGSKLYFYTLDQGYQEEIVSVRDALNSQLSKKAVGQLKDLRQLLPGNKWTLPQCARLIEKDGEWELTFHYIKGMRYHRTFGKHVTATLMLQFTPIVKLSEENKDKLFGYWDETRTTYKRPRGEYHITTDGMNYRANRNLMCNMQFRQFTVNLFSMIASAEKKYILKDIGRTISECGFFLPSIPFEDIIKFHTPKDMICSLEHDSSELSINFNKLDMNTGYIIAKLAPVIIKDDWADLSCITPDIVKQCFALKNAYDGFKSFDSVKDFILNYYSYVRGFSGIQTRGYLQDYVNMCLCCNEPIKLSSSFKKLVEAHDIVAHNMSKRELLEVEENKPIVTVPSKFDNLEESLDTLYPGGFQRMHTYKQLLVEGEFQHNCVYSRKDLIKNDHVAVFHWDYENASHTIQFAIDGCYKYYIDEIKARFNANCSDSAMSKLQEILDEINKRDTDYVIPSCIKA